jgi:hypothetical protein
MKPTEEFEAQDLVRSEISFIWLVTS